MPERSYPRNRAVLAYSFGHALIDAVSAAIVLYLVFQSTNASDAALYAVLYNVLAFGLQAPLGAFADRFNLPWQMAIAGNMLAILALLITAIPLAAVCAIGLANAMFHIGGGIVALRLAKGTASLPGIYVATGGIGLFFGGILGAAGNLFTLGFSVLLVCTSIVVYKLRAPPALNRRKMKVSADFAGVALLLLLLAIAARAFVGFSLNFPWKTGFDLPLLLVLGIALGKALGGIFADRFGFIRTAIIAVLLSAPLLSFGAAYPLVGIAGALLFNFAMPVTLVAIARMLPAWEGFSFGLTTLALVSGSLAAFIGLPAFFKQNAGALAVLIAVTAAVLYLGLKKSGSKR